MKRMVKGLTTAALGLPLALSVGVGLAPDAPGAGLTEVEDVVTGGG